MHEAYAKNRPALLALGLWASVVALATLWPEGPVRPVTWDTFLCVACSPRDGADFFLNWLLFVPGGALLAVHTTRGRALLAACVGSLLIEVLQLGIPARDPALQDLFANALGAGTGIVMVDRGRDRLVRATLLAVALLAWLAPVALLRPTPAGTALLVEWTPLDASGRYDGNVVSASVADSPLAPGLAPIPELVDQAVLMRGTLRATVEVGSAARPERRVFRVTDVHAHDIVNLSIAGSDLVLRGKTVAVDLGFTQPAVRWEGALEGVLRGDTVEIRVDRADGSVCARVDDASRCGLAPKLSDGWAFLLNFHGTPGWWRDLMRVVWSAAVGSLIGIAAGRVGGAFVLGSSIAVLGALAATVSPDTAPDPVSPLLLLLGCVGAATTLGRSSVQSDAPRV